MIWVIAGVVSAVIMVCRIGSAVVKEFVLQMSQGADG
jgi:ABC-type thiamin/hydroxymethylpyrimidine transport system permease subunit